MRTCTHTKRVWVSETMGICVSGHRLKMRELAHELSGRQVEADEVELGQRPSESGPGRGLLRAQSTGSSAGGRCY